MKHIQGVSDQIFFGNTSTPKEVNLELTIATYIPPPDKTISMVWYFLVLEVNGLLYTT